MTKINQIETKSQRIKIGPGRRLNNWLTSYIKYTDDNEAPTLFHIWCGLGAISAATGRQIWLNMKYFEVFSNLFFILVAPPGTARKTTALKISRNLAMKVPGLQFCPQEASPQAIIKRMSEIGQTNKEHQSVMAYSLELGTLLGKGPKQDGMIDFLTDIFDCNAGFVKETIGRGEETVTHPWFALAGATQPVWIKDHMAASALDTGFVSRCLWIYADQRKLSNPLPEDDLNAANDRKLLLNDLCHISTLNGEVKLSPEAKDYYVKWYMDDSRFPKSTDSRMGNYFERKHIHLLKVSMLLSVAMGDSLIIEDYHLKAALELLEDMEPGMHKSFTGVGKNAFSGDVERIYAQITEHGDVGMAYSAIISANYHALTKDELDRVLQQLAAMHRITLRPGNVYVIRRKTKPSD